MTDRSERPHPPPASDLVRARMERQRRRDTAPEMALRRELHRRGLRFRVDRRPEPAVRRRADLVFTRARVAVLVDGCFWHACSEHGTWPVSNADWWRKKLERTVARDRETDRLLAHAGWTVVRVWEHEDADEAADRVQKAVSGPPQQPVLPTRPDRPDANP